ncbi:MAG: PEP-CTERM sorting domain-containing protein [Verrucomicrobiota bacterium]|jgi:hypothetical protein
MKKISVMIFGCSLGLAVQAQSVIDTLSGDLSRYTTTLVNDTSDGAGQGVSFTSSASGLQANYVGTGTAPEQAVFLAPASSFGTVFGVGDTLYVNTGMAQTSVQEDFGLAISATATPTPAGAANYNTRPTFDWTSISLRPSGTQPNIRVNTSISGTVTTSGGAANITSVADVSELFITWNSADSFTLGYIYNGVSTTDETVTFASGSAIGTAIGFYGDLRATGTSLGDFTDLTIVPEPSTVALCGLGLIGLVFLPRRKQ